MKKLLLLGAALLGLCAVGQTARAGGDPDYTDDRPTYRHYEEPAPAPRCYLPPPPPVYYAPPLAYVYPRAYYHHRRYYRPYGYGYARPYGYGYAPGIHIGIGF